MADAKVKCLLENCKKEFEIPIPAQVGAVTLAPCPAGHMHSLTRVAPTQSILAEIPHMQIIDTPRG
jgi:hypothetical protein